MKKTVFSFLLLASSTLASAQFTGKVDPAFPGVELDGVALTSSNGTEVSVSANLVYAGRPDGFYRQFLSNLSATVIPAEGEALTVTFINDCLNYDGDAFTAAITCDVVDSVATLSRETCSYFEPESHINFNFFNNERLYQNGRTGYYQAQRCQLKMAIDTTAGWLVDPINGSHDFLVDFDAYYSVEADYLRN
ncbi:MAG: hypothetical protein HRU19_15715 [Pseudobacteriovorax sp.]|nr:hypothetical protein [Pseudobacteriovorax sp.]